MGIRPAERYVSGGRSLRIPSSAGEAYAQETPLARRVAIAIAGIAVPATVSAPAARAAGPCGTATAAPAYQHVAWIWLENKSYGDIIGNSSAPYLNSLAAQCGLATNFHNTSHPSLPNYIAATSGSSQNPFDGIPALAYTDCNPGFLCDTGASSIFSQGESWKAYEESMPSNCYRANSGEYAVRHNPPPYYTSLSGCSSNDVPYTQLAADLADNALPAFSWITPNLIDDMHDGTVADGDNWLAANLPAILNSAAYASGTTALFITVDEGSGGSTAESCYRNTSDESCHIPTWVISPSTPAGARSATFFNHYSLLATAEQLLGLPLLREAASYPSMTSAFNL